VEVASRDAACRPISTTQVRRLTARCAAQGAVQSDRIHADQGAQIAEVAIPGLDSPLLQFVRGQTETLTLELFFDSTEAGMGRDATPVTAETDRFYQLIKIESAQHAPPIVLFSWGGKEFPGIARTPASGVSSATASSALSKASGSASRCLAPSGCRCAPHLRSR